MEWAQWLKGGPFLEVSFLLELKEEKTKTIQDIINKLFEITNKIEIVDKNVDEIIDFFVRGYPYDEDDPKSTFIHSLRLRLYVELYGKRKATLQVEMISSNALIVDFWFFGSIFDAPEWDQIGIKENETIDFTNFLKELYFVYDYNIGGMAIEEDVRSLFGFDEAYPNECYCYENISLDLSLLESYGFIDIIWSEKYKKLNQIPYNHKRLDKNGVLINIGSIDK
ncbi:hypothetical protein [Bacillus sp. AFS017336]|uniref:hypothetical protein n=1 Tax=Bacillus sp. AFS017336 TaxID=2033489 RepID=UPI000BF09053|nr:hypothetical protein [Bacillus sp. AFS017336]PEL11989.1 hypothetical protein CN601_09360 [Bacillus sp. AFS017336]